MDMDTKEQLSHRIRIAQLSSRKLSALAQDYEAALSSEVALNEFLETLRTEINQIHNVVLFTEDLSGMIAEFILRKVLQTTSVEESLQKEAARVYIASFYNVNKTNIPYKYLSSEQFQQIYMRGKRKLS